MQEGPGLRRHGEGRHREPDQVAGAQVRRQLDGPRRLQVERPEQLVERSRHARHPPAVDGHRHRRLRLVRVGVHGHPVAARRRRREALGRAVEGVRRAEVEERRVGVVELLDDAEPEGLRVLDERQVLRVHVLDLVPDGSRTGPGPQSRVERPVGRLEIGPHVQRRHALVGRHRVEPAGIGFRRQRPGQVQADRFVDVQQILHGVGVLEAREPPQRGAQLAAGREVRVDERPLQRAERGLDHRRIGLPGGARRHLATPHPLVDPLPRAERGGVGQIVAQAAEVERRHRPGAVAGHAGGLDQRPHVRLERLRGGRGRREAREQQRDAHRKPSLHRVTHLQVPRRSSRTLTASGVPLRPAHGRGAAPARDERMDTIRAGFRRASRARPARPRDGGRAGRPPRRAQRGVRALRLRGGAGGRAGRPPRRAQRTGVAGVERAAAEVSPPGATRGSPASRSPAPACAGRVRCPGARAGSADRRPGARSRRASPA